MWKMRGEKRWESKKKGIEYERFRSTGRKAGRGRHREKKNNELNTERREEGEGWGGDKGGMRQRGKRTRNRETC